MINFLDTFHDPFFSSSFSHKNRNHPSLFNSLFDDSLDLFLQDCQAHARGIRSKPTSEVLVNPTKPTSLVSRFTNDSSSFSAEWKDDKENNAKKLVLSKLPTGEGSKVDVKIHDGKISILCESTVKKESDGFKSFSSSRVERSFSLPSNVDFEKISNASSADGNIEIIFPLLTSKPALEDAASPKVSAETPSPVEASTEASSSTEAPVEASDSTEHFTEAHADASPETSQ